MTTKKALVLLADGSEEMEFVIPVDIFRRAEISVTTAGVGLKNGTYAECSRGVKILPDVEVEHVGDDYDAIVIPGGAGGSKILAENAQVLLWPKLPIFLKVTKSLHTLVSNRSLKTATYRYSEDRVVVDQNVITSRGPGTAFLFALTIVEKLVGKEVTVIHLFEGY
ncbi:hypothetical protein NQZ79_g7454 [Umbelopsis isabellina]|nr:hypothetical protein NQZ79_g7454 [Umbelopsis isabellina]